MSRLSLADSVFFAVTEGQGVFLDLNRDDYSAVPLDIDLRLTGEALDDAILEALQPYRDELIEAGLLKFDPVTDASMRSYLSIARPRANIFHPDDQRAFGLVGEGGQALRTRSVDWFDFWVACRRAARLLNMRHIHEIVRDVRTRRGGLRAPSVDETREQTAIFRKLRPFYPRRYLCLFDGLALVEFLARRGSSVDWIFAVQAQPFGAHCWVQVDGYLLNEATEYAAQFTPIMAA